MRSIYARRYTRVSETNCIARLYTRQRVTCTSTRASFSSPPHFRVFRPLDNGRRHRVAQDTKSLTRAAAGQGRRFSASNVVERISGALFSNIDYRTRGATGRQRYNWGFYTGEFSVQELRDGFIAVSSLVTDLVFVEKRKLVSGKAFDNSFLKSLQLDLFKLNLIIKFSNWKKISIISKYYSLKETFLNFCHYFFRLLYYLFA